MNGDLRVEYLDLTAALGYGDDRTDRAASPRELIDPLSEAIHVAQTHDSDCPEWCDECDQWERPRSCEECYGSGCSPLTALGAYDPCPSCTGEGRDHMAFTPTGTWRGEPL